MKKAILILSLAGLSFCAFSQKMEFVTLDVKFKTLPVQEEDGSWSGQCIAWYGVKANGIVCPYSKETANQWIGFVQFAIIFFKSPVTKDTDVIKKAGLDAAEEYRKKNYPDIQ